MALCNKALAPMAPVKKSPLDAAVAAFVRLSTAWLRPQLAYLAHSLYHEHRLAAQHHDFKITR